MQRSSTQRTYTGRHLLQDADAPVDVNLVNISGLILFYATGIEVKMIDKQRQTQAIFYLPLDKKGTKGSSAEGTSGVYV